MRMTKDGIALVQSFESCSLAAYRDVTGKLTIGWGRSRGVSEGDTCTQDQADAWLAEDLAFFELAVLACVGVGKVTLTDNHLSALISFCFNVGLGYKGVKDGFKTLKSGEPSTMLECLLKREFEWAAAEFPKWSKAGGVECAGILRRRLAEQKLF